MKKREKKEKKINYLALGLILLAVNLSLFVVLTQQAQINNIKILPFEESKDFNYLNPYSDLKYNAKEKIVTDVTNLSYDFKNKKIMITGLNGVEGGFEFYIKADGEEYHLNEPVKRKNLVSGGHVFSNKEEVNGLKIEQEIIFSNKRPVKFNHYIVNNKNIDLNDLTYYYVFDLLPGEGFIYKDIFCEDYNNCTDFAPDIDDAPDPGVISFDKGFLFVYEDLLKTGFYLDEVSFDENKLYAGFKNNQSLNAGNKIDLDPVFESYRVNALDLAVLSNDTYAVIWGDYHTYDVNYRPGIFTAIYHTSGIQIGDTITIDPFVDSLSTYNDRVGIDAFNETYYVATWFESINANTWFGIFDNQGNIIINNTVWGTASYGRTSDVSTFNSTHFVLFKSKSGSERTMFEIWDFEGNEILDEPTFQTDIGSDPFEVSVDSFNSTHFIGCTYDSTYDGVRCLVGDVEGAISTNDLWCDGATGASKDVSVSVFNETHFICSYMDANDNDWQYSVIDVDDNSILWTQEFEQEIGDNWGFAGSVAAINETHFVTGYTQYDKSDIIFQTYDLGTRNLWKNISSDDGGYGRVGQVVTRNYAAELQFCDNQFVFAFNNDSEGRTAFQTYYFNGTKSGGWCSNDVTRMFVNFPLENQTLFTLGGVFNVTFDAENEVDECVFSLDGDSNVTMTNNGGKFWISNDIVFKKSTNYEIEFWCNDTSGNTEYAYKNFSTYSSNRFTDQDTLAIWMSPLDEDTFVMIWNEDVSDRVWWQVFDTTGKSVTEPIEAYNTTRLTYPFNHPVSVTSLNSTHFVISWYSHWGDALYWNLYDIKGINITGGKFEDGYLGFSDGGVVSLASLNETHVVVVYVKDYAGSGDIEYDIWDVFNNVEIVDSVDVDNDWQGSDPNLGSNTISVDAFNETHFVIAWWDAVSDDASARVFAYPSTSISTVDADTEMSDSSAGALSSSVEVSTMNETHYVVAYYDRYEGDASFSLFDVAGNNITTQHDVDISVGVRSGSVGGDVAVDSINSSHFVYAYYDEDDDDYSFRIYDYNRVANTFILDLVNVDNSADAHDISVMSQNTGRDIGICNDNFILAWVNKSNEAVWHAFYANGTIWNGVCDDLDIEIISPTNSTLASSYVSFNVTAISISYSIDKCIYNLDGGENQSMSQSGSLWYDFDTVTFGSHDAYFYCNNTNGTMASGSVNFIMDNGNESCTWWYNPFWSFRKNLIINSSLVFDNHTNFPFAINHTDLSLKLYSQDDGYDILFTDSGGCNKLDHEIEVWDKSTGYIAAWVKVPELNDSSDTIIQMYYGNNLSGDQQNVESLWEEYSLVYHLSDMSLDSSGNTEGTPSSTAAQSTSAKIGNSTDFVSTSADINVGVIGSPLLTAETTVSFWMYLNSYTSRMNPFDQAYGGWGTMTTETSGYISWFFGSNGGDDSPYNPHASSTNMLGNGVWIYVTSTRTPSASYNYTWYKNGSYDTSASYTSTFPVINTRLFTIGDGYSSDMDGIMDEFRVTQGVTRNAGWIKTEYYNQLYSNDSYQVGGDEPYSCSYIGSGNWEIDCNDNCSITSPVVGDGSNISIKGHGHTVILANITGFENIFISGEEGHCRVTCREGGCIQT
jgi:hypothetical protein